MGKDAVSVLERPLLGEETFAGRRWRGFGEAFLHILACCFFSTHMHTHIDTRDFMPKGPSPLTSNE